MWFRTRLRLFAGTVAVARCATTESLARNAADSVKLVQEAPTSTVFVAALEAVAGGEPLKITSQDEPKGGQVKGRRHGD